jgi:hypothetical protein
MTLWCRRCGRYTPHRVLQHTTPATTMCYECNEYEFRPIATAPLVKPPQASPSEQPRTCQRCYSGAAGGDCLFGVCLMLAEDKAQNQANTERAPQKLLDT